MNDTRDIAFYIMNRSIYKHNTSVNVTKLNRLCYICYAVALANGECICAESPVAFTYGITYYSFLYNDVVKTTFWEDKVKKIEITDYTQKLIDDTIDLYLPKCDSSILCQLTKNSYPWKIASNNGQVLPAYVDNEDIITWARNTLLNSFVNLEEKYPELKEKNNLYYKEQQNNRIKNKRRIKSLQYDNTRLFSKNGELGWLNPFNWLP